MIDNVKDASVMQDCGCYFGLPGEEKKKLPKWIFLAELNEKSAWMNIDGRDVKLRLTHSTDQGRAGVRNRLTRTYVAAGIKVSVLYITIEYVGPTMSSANQLITMPPSRLLKVPENKSFD
jgi:hypothetical protein